MRKNSNQHLGDDQLIHGLPKHMQGIANTDANAYWEIVPGKNACFTCQTMRGKRFAYKQGPVHPNCTCEMRRVAPPEHQVKEVAFGRLQGFEDKEMEKFQAGQVITVEIRNLGPLPAAIWIRVDHTQWVASRYVTLGETQSFRFSKFGDVPMTWEVSLFYLGLDASVVEYKIRG